MRMGTVESEVVSKIGFSGSPNTEGTLRIEFHDGTAVSYKDVPYRVFRQFVLARKSHGAFYNQKIRGKFKTT